MKLIPLLLAALPCALANFEIATPVSGQLVTAGKNLLVGLKGGLDPTGATMREDVAVAIGLEICTSSNGFCTPNILGEVLYNGPISRDCNYTVNIPGDSPAGNYSLGVTFFSLNGTENEPQLITHLVPIKIVHSG